MKEMRNVRPAFEVFEGSKVIFQLGFNKSSVMSFGMSSWVKTSVEKLGWLREEQPQCYSLKLWVLPQCQ